MVYTYFVNLRRKADDTKKRNYHAFAVLIMPFTLPLFLILGILLFILRFLLFTALLIVFAFLLITVRKPFIFEWWHKFATALGDPLLKVNTYLIKTALGH
jgi:tellurite resistance protein TehA-like permease